MKILTWIQMSILVALVISWPLIVGAGMSKGDVGILSLIGGALLLRLTRRPRPQQH